MQLKDVAVLITGGGSGLGAATARAMAAKGAKIGVLDQSKENAEKVAAEVGGVALHADVTDEEQVKAALAKAEAAHGIARVLMNCAGIGGSQRIVGKDGVYPLAKFARIVNVNLIGTFNCLRLFAERLVTAEPIGEERGVIINTASVAAYEGQIGQIAYAASKGGVVGLTLPAARDLASQKIRVNTIAPGLFLTPLLMGLNEEARKSLGAQVPHPARLGDASEYGNLAVHIVEHPMLNGEAKRVVDSLTQALLDLKLKPGSSVAILSGNSIEHAQMTMAAMQARFPAAPVSPAYSLMSQDHVKLKYLFELIRPAVVMVQDG